MFTNCWLTISDVNVCGIKQKIVSKKKFFQHHKLCSTYLKSSLMKTFIASTTDLLNQQTGVERENTVGSRKTSKRTKRRKDRLIMQSWYKIPVHYWLPFSLAESQLRFLQDPDGWRFCLAVSGTSKNHQKYWKNMKLWYLWDKMKFKHFSFL